MDIITQAILGGAVGLSTGGRRLGRKAITAGIIGGLFPDLDVFFIRFAGPLGEYTVHRGPTHGLLFCLISGLFLGYLMWWYFNRDDKRLRNTWMRVMTLAVATHPLLDIFTSYGTQLFWPFSTMRIASAGVSVIDPFYTLPLLITLIYGWVTRADRGSVTTNNWVLGATTLYLFLGLGLSQYVSHRVNKLPEAQGANRVTVQKTLGQTFLHRVLIDHDDRLVISYMSTLHPKRIVSETFTKNPYSCKKSLSDNPDVQLFEWFTGGNYLVEEQAPGVYDFTDTRYGLIQTPAAKGIGGMRIVLDPHSCKQVGHPQRFANISRNALPKALKLIFTWAFGGPKSD